MPYPRKNIPADSLRKLYLAEGLTPRAIGLRLGVGETAVRQRLLALGIPLRTRGAAQRLARGVSLTRVRLTQLYDVEGLSHTQIARRLGCSVDAIQAAMKRFGLAARSPSASARLARGVAIPEEELRRLYETAGLSASAIAERYGCSASAVYQRLREYGITRRSPWAKQAVEIGEAVLRQLYVDEGLTLEVIAERYRCSAATISRQLKRYGIPARPFNTPVYPRADFSGDLVEKAYLIGFRLGDLDVFEEGQTIVVSTSTTKQAQLELVRSLFNQYGHLRENSGQQSKVWLRCGLNQTFRFLLPKEDAIPEWVLNKDETFLSFLAGYTDAEGSFRDAPTFVLRTYDSNLLQICWVRLKLLGIVCPSPRLTVKAGYINKAGVISRGDQWDLAIHRRESLRRFIELLLPYLKHAKRRQDAQQVLEVVQRKNKKQG